MIVRKVFYLNRLGVGDEQSRPANELSLVLATKTSLTYWLAMPVVKWAY